jgi:NAD(P)-dependent dehydrogenase (short-subunit alcohol dehydrogenase family)
MIEQSKKEVVLITGASSGIGKVTAKKLIEEGHIVYAAARRVDEMDDLMRLGGVPLQMDISVEEDVVAVVERIAQDHGGVDILINNAGFGLYGAMEDIPLDQARYQFDVNLFGLARLTQLVLPHMRRQGAGKIVNISSMGGKIYTPLGAWYHASKHALEGWSDCLRIELKPFNIDVIIIEPGSIETGFNGFVEPMLERSGEGPYGDLAQAMAEAAEDNDGSPPSVIAETILEAVAARRPRTRYVAGSLARPLILARRYLGDRVFDRVVSMMVR